MAKIRLFSHFRAFWGVSLLRRYNFPSLVKERLREALNCVVLDFVVSVYGGDAGVLAWHQSYLVNFGLSPVRLWGHHRGAESLPSQPPSSHSPSSGTEDVLPVDKKFLEK